MDNRETIKKLREKMTQKEYAQYLNLSIRIIQTWEYRGTSKTTLLLLSKINDLEKENKRLKKQLEDSNKTFMLPK